MLQRGRKGPTQQVMTVAHRRRSSNNRALSSIDPPAHLSDATKAWWSTILNEYRLGGSELRTLTIACEAFDRREQAREALAQHGLSYTDAKGMVRARPEVAIERDSAIRFLRAMRELNLNAEPPDHNRRVIGALSWRQLQQQSPFDDVE